MEKKLSLLLLVVLGCCCCVQAASTGVPATPRSRGGAGGGSVAVDGEDGGPHPSVNRGALQEEPAHDTEPALRQGASPDDGSVLDAEAAAEETSPAIEAQPHEAGSHVHNLGEVVGTEEHLAEIAEEPQTEIPKTPEELIAEELKNRDDELKRRDDELVKRDEELKRRDQEQVRRKEELERRNVEELLREEELQRRQEEEERRAHADRLVEEELERRKVAAEIASAASASSAALTSGGTFPEDARNKRHEEMKSPTSQDDGEKKLDEERQLAENLSRKEEIEIKHFEDGLAHQAAGVEQHQHEAYEHEQIARQREELIRKMETDRRQQEEEVKMQEEARQRDELEKVQREQEYIIQQENKKREMEDEPHQHLRIEDGASDSVVSAAASLSLLLLSLLGSLAPVRV